MDTEIITSNATLKERIKRLEIEREKYEVLILVNSKELYNTVRNPASYIKSTVKELASDRDFRLDLVVVGLNLATKYLLKKFGGSGGSKTSFFSDLLARFTDDKENEKTTTSNSNTIIDLISKLLSGKQKTAN